MHRKRTGNEGVVGEVEGGKVGHLWSAAVRVLAVSQELVDRVEGVRLNGIVGGEDDEHGCIRLECVAVSQKSHQAVRQERKMS